MTVYEKLGANRLFKGLPRDALQPVYERGVIIEMDAGKRSYPRGSNQ